jgi:RNA polymerase-binding transcription factor DksA
MADRKTVLETLQSELLDRLGRYRAHKQRQSGALDKDTEEQAVEIQNDDVVDSLEKEAEEELRQVQHALDRLAMGEGDLCEVCEEPIAPARLEALPYTTWCRECAGP